jgi:hypothetical protein
MSKLYLPDVTLLSIDTTRPDRTLKALAACERYVEFGDKLFIVSGMGSFTTTSGIRVAPTDEVHSYRDYNHFVIKRLASFVHTSFVLIVQHDGFILNPGAWSDAFLDYDYVGAPWLYRDNHNVGNGGFSLRSKRLLDCLQADDQITKFCPEDHQICRTYGSRLTQAGIRFAPETVARQFSIEGSRHAMDPIGRGRVWTGEFGFHRLDTTDIRLWDDIGWFLDTRLSLSSDPHYVAS